MSREEPLCEVKGQALCIIRVASMHSPNDNSNIKETRVFSTFH
jgi:hypothetical protein